MSSGQEALREGRSQRKARGQDADYISHFIGLHFIAAEIGHSLQTEGKATFGLAGAIFAAAHMIAYIVFSKSVLS